MNPLFPSVSALLSSSSSSSFPPSSSTPGSKVNSRPGSANRRKDEMNPAVSSSSSSSSSSLPSALSLPPSLISVGRREQGSNSLRTTGNKENNNNNPTTSTPSTTTTIATAAPPTDLHANMFAELMNRANKRNERRITNNSLTAHSNPATTTVVTATNSIPNSNHIPNKELLVPSSSSVSLSLSPSPSSALLPLSSEDPSSLSSVHPDLYRMDSLLSSVPSSSPFYTKRLNSDVENSEAARLLEETSKTNALFNIFTPEDLLILAEIFAVLRFNEGEKIIEQGEEATFVGIILSGQFQAIVNEEMRVKLYQGDMLGKCSTVFVLVPRCLFLSFFTLFIHQPFPLLLFLFPPLFPFLFCLRLSSLFLGEQSLFEGGVRNASVVSSSSAVLAVISFEELSNLSEIDPGLSRKLLFLFASASIKKIRKLKAGMPQTQSTVAEKEGKEGEGEGGGIGKEGIKKESIDSSSSPNINVKSLPSEFLYRWKAKKNEENGGNREKEKEREKQQKTIESEQLKRMKAEHKLRNFAVKYENNMRKLEKTEGEVKEMEGKLVRLERIVNDKEKMILQLSEKKQEQKGTISSLQLTIEEQNSKINALNREILTIKLNSGNAFISQIDSMKEEMKSKEEEIEKWKMKEKERKEEKEEVEKKNNQLLNTIEEKNRSEEKLNGQIEEGRAVIMELTNKNNELLRLINEQNSYSTQMEKKLKESEENCMQLVPYKEKSRELMLALETERKRGMRDNDYNVGKMKEMEKDLSRYKKLVQYLSISFFMKEYKLKRLLIVLHTQVSDLLLLLMQEQLEEKIKYKYNATASSSSSPASSSSDSSSSSSSSSSQNPEFVSQLKFEIKQLKKRKLRSIDSFLVNKSKPFTIALSMETDLQKMKNPIEDLQTMIGHWKGTSSAFFNRTIELTNEIVGKENKIGKVKETMELMQNELNALKQENGEKEKRIQELIGKMNAMKGEMERMEKEKAKSSKQQLQLQVEQGNYNQYNSNNNNGNGTSGSNGNSNSNSNGGSRRRRENNSFHHHNSTAPLQLNGNKNHYPPPFVPAPPFSPIVPPSFSSSSSSTSSPSAPVLHLVPLFSDSSSSELKEQYAQQFTSPLHQSSPSASSPSPPSAPVYCVLPLKNQNNITPHAVENVRTAAAIYASSPPSKAGKSSRSLSSSSSRKGLGMGMGMGEVHPSPFTLKDQGRIAKQEQKLFLPVLSPSSANNYSGTSHPSAGHYPHHSTPQSARF